jgi:hypothetical protein
MSTGRPILGVATLGAVSGALVFALQTKNGFDVGTFTDPFGNSYVDSIPKTSRPNFVAAAAGAAVLWLGGAFEAAAFAKRSRARAESILSREPARTENRVSLRIDRTDRGLNVGMKIETSH